MAVFNFIEKRQKSCFLPSGFFFRNHRSLQNQKSPFTVKFSPCSSLEVTLFVLICFLEIQPFVLYSAACPCLDFQHHDCTSCQEIANFFFSYLYKIYCHSDLPRKFRACCHFQQSQILKYMPWQVKKFISSRIPKLLRFGAAIIFPVTRATSKIRKRSSSPYSLL